MRRILASALIFVCLLLPANGSGWLPLVKAGSAYTGIGDLANIPTAFLAYGAHCYKSSYVGNIVDVYSAANATTMATLTCSSGGVIGATGTWTLAQVKSNCTATHDCYAIKLYDQSGANFCSGSTACNSVTGNTTNSPWLVTADGSSTCGSGSTFANANTFCLQTNTPSITNIATAALGSSVAQPITYLITYATLSAGTQGALIRDNSTATAAVSDSSATTAGSYAGGSVITVTASEAQWHTYQATLNGASSYLQIDNGTASTSSPGTGTIANGATFNIGSDGSGGTPFYGFLGDIVAFRSTSISTAASAVYANEKAFWGGGMP